MVLYTCVKFTNSSAAERQRRGLRLRHRVPERTARRLPLAALRRRRSGGHRGRARLLRAVGAHARPVAVRALAEGRARRAQPAAARALSSSARARAGQRGAQVRRRDTEIDSRGPGLNRLCAGSGCGTRAGSWTKRAPDVRRRRRPRPCSPPTRARTRRSPKREPHAPERRRRSRRRRRAGGTLRTSCRVSAPS